MSRSEELEREVEEQRARVDRSLSALQDKMSVGQFVDEAGRYVHIEDFRQGFGNFGRQVRDNPLALALVGAGVGWLVLGSGERHRRPRHLQETTGSYRTARLHETEPYRGAEPYQAAELHRDAGHEDHDDEHHGSAIGSIGSKASAAGRKAGEVGSRAASALSETGRQTGQRARSAYDYGRRMMHDMRDGAEERSSSIYRGGRHYGGRMSRMFSDAMENEPLVIGAFALAVGVAIGAAMPSTRREDELFGDMRDEVFSRAGDTARSASHRVADAAKETYATARQAAADEGLTGGETIAEKVEKVARKTAAEAKDQASGKTSGSTSSSPGVSNRP